MTSDEACQRLGKAAGIRGRLSLPRLPHVSLTLRLIILVLIAVLPAIAIRAASRTPWSSDDPDLATPARYFKSCPMPSLRLPKALTM